MVRGAAAKGNQNPPQDVSEGVAMLVNLCGLTDAEVRESIVHMAQTIKMQAQSMTAQVNLQDVQEENPPVCSMAYRLRDFTRINPPIFTRSKISENPQEFMDELHNILMAMGIPDTKKVELASYQLKEVAHTWCKMWQHSCVHGGVTITQEFFKTSFLERFFPRQMRDAMVEVFINLKTRLSDSQGVLTVLCLAIKVCQFSQY